MAISKKSPLLVQGLVDWFDFSRPAELTFNGGDISAARNIDGSNRNALMATAGQQPFYSPNGMLNRGSLQFTAANNDELTLQNALAIAQNKVGLTVLGVMRVSALALTQRMLTILSSTGNGLLTVGVTSANKLQIQARRVAADSIATFGSPDNVPANQNFFFGVSVQYSNGQMGMYLGDAFNFQTAGWVAGATSENAAASTAGSLGRNSSGGVLDGFLGEIAVYDRALTRHEVHEMRVGYFRPKWRAV